MPIRGDGAMLRPRNSISVQRIGRKRTFCARYFQKSSCLNPLIYVRK